MSEPEIEERVSAPTQSQESRDWRTRIWRYGNAPPVIVCRYPGYEDRQNEQLGGRATRAREVAHLQKDSICVTLGQKVKANQGIGKAGHSGNAVMPHLHMQFMDSADYRKANGLPFLFRSYEVLRKGEWMRVHDSVPTKEDIIGF